MVAADSFMYFPEDVFAFFKGNTFHEDARGRALVLVVTDEKKTLDLFWRSWSIDLLWRR